MLQAVGISTCMTCSCSLLCVGNSINMLRFVVNLSFNGTTTRISRGFPRSFLRAIYCWKAPLNQVVLNVCACKCARDNACLLPVFCYHIIVAYSLFLSQLILPLLFLFGTCRHSCGLSERTDHWASSACYQCNNRSRRVS